MRWLKALVLELMGLFVDDGRFACAILLWVGLQWLAMPRLPLAKSWSAPILVIGLLGILLESVWRSARPRVRRT